MATYLSTYVGGSTPSGRGADRIGTVPDVRFTINDRPMGAKTKDVALHEQWKHKGLALITADMYGPDVNYITHGIGSSTLVDTDGDVFHKSAIDVMAKDSIDLNVLLNHTPTLPWSIFGSILETDVDFLTLHDGTEHTVLKLVTDVERKHPDSWRTYELINGIDCKARKLGYSVGCLYTDARPRQTKSGLYRGHDVFEVLPVEFSIVTMPANRLAWIETIGQDLQEKSVLKSLAGTPVASRGFATAQSTLEAITDWMDFGPVDGPKLEKLARYFEAEYGIVYAKRPRLTRSA